MGKKIAVAVIIITLVFNVVLLQQTIHAYYAMEYDRITYLVVCAIIMVIAAGISYMVWRKAEYRRS